MRGIDIFCASQAATSICHSMDQASSSSSTANPGGSRLLDRHNPIIGRSFHLPPCTFQQQQHIDPIPYNLLHQNGRKSSSAAKTDHQIKDSKRDGKNQKKKKKPTAKSGGGGGDKENQVVSGDVLRKVFGGGELVTPPGSTRYLLGDKGALVDVLSDFESIVSLAPVGDDDSKSRPVKTEEVTEDSVSDSKLQTVVKKTEEGEDDSVSDSKPPLTPLLPPPSSRSPDQVVVLRVSLHCRGCAGKVKKHISKMQGVKSYNIDFVAKKVTVVGDVTPLEVLSSISKVKNAQLWTPGMPPLPFTGAAAPTSTTAYSMTNNNKAPFAT